MMYARVAAMLTMGLATLASLAASAEAAPGSLEFGKCEKVAEGTGAFGNSTCTKLGKRRDFEWHPLSEPVGITITKTRETASLILAIDHPFGGETADVTCTTESSVSGSAIATGLTNVVLRATGCQALGASCTAEGQPAGVVVSNKLLATPGIIAKNSEGKEQADIVGLDFKGEAANAFGPFECGPGIRVFIRGGVIAQFPVNKAIGTAKYEYRQEHDKQIPEGFAEGPAEFLEWSINEGEWNRSQLGFEATLKPAVAKTKIELRHCEANVC